MATLPPGILVELGFNADEPQFRDESEPLWSTSALDGDGFEVREGPEFFAATDAVMWWREQGETTIYVQLELNDTRQWAGVGKAPTDPHTGQPMPIFSEADARGSREGAISSLRRAGETFNQWWSEMMAAEDRKVGARFADLRSASGISIDVVASRAAVSRQWLEDVESGLLARQVTLPQWIDLVWSIREPWPDERRSRIKIPTEGFWAPYGYSRLNQAEDLVRDACRDVEA